jgi:nucleotide-binding universal stress UspA family protein
MTAATPFENILLYVEPNERGLEAARYAIALAKGCRGEIHAVSVINERILEELTRARVFLKEEGVDLLRDLEEDGRRYLSFVEKLAREKGVDLTTDLRRGAVHREVLNKAKDLGATLIVLGEIEEALSRKDVTFNESERIVSDARCPVLIVKGKGLVKALFNAL